jgi:hypothetical protein
MGLQPGYDAFRAAALDRRAEVATTMLARRTQTNEPARCATLIPALASLRQPLALLEVGASAGLCLFARSLRLQPAGELDAAPSPETVCHKGLWHGWRAAAGPGVRRRLARARPLRAARGPS